VAVFIGQSPDELHRGELLVQAIEVHTAHRPSLHPSTRVFWSWSSINQINSLLHRSSPEQLCKSGSKVILYLSDMFARPSELKVPLLNCHTKVSEQDTWSLLSQKPRFTSTILDHDCRLISPQLGPCSCTVTLAGLGELRRGNHHHPFWACIPQLGNNINAYIYILILQQISC
jgi:hypothetical protein